MIKEKEQSAHTISVDDALRRLYVTVTGIIGQQNESKPSENKNNKLSRCKLYLTDFYLLYRSRVLKKYAHSQNLHIRRKCNKGETTDIIHSNRENVVQCEKMHYVGVTLF